MDDHDDSCQGKMTEARDEGGCVGMSISGDRDTDRFIQRAILMIALAFPRSSTR